MKREKLEFYDPASNTRFETDNYEVMQKDDRSFAVAKSPDGKNDCWRFISMDQAQDLM